jgi:hypothetical protein
LQNIINNSYRFFIKSQQYGRCRIICFSNGINFKKTLKSVLCNYGIQCLTSEYMIPIFGYGAKLIPETDTISQCFAINGNIF